MKVGDTVPDLEFDVFQSEKIRKARLSDYRGKWLVLAFYPADFTFVCPTELAELADNYADFRKAGAEIVSMSTDTAFVHKAWHDTSPLVKRVKYPMGADPSHSVCKAFGTSQDREGTSLRATFIISPEGVVKAFEMHDNSIGRSAKEILRKLQAACFVAKHKGMVCPAGWTPGKGTLRPGMKLVGKI